MPAFTEHHAAHAPWRQWGDDLDEQSVRQMQNACSLPVAVAGALMPDAHLGYGLPIGGVLATDNCVIPYAVGVDIACRMKLTVLDLPALFLFLWNKIEHRLFCHITRNWQGIPLEDLIIVINLIGSTKTETGLEVHAWLDRRQYEKARKITDAQLIEVHIKRNTFHGDWNYKILPNS